MDLYRATDCTGHDLGLGMSEPITKYAEGIAGEFYQKVGDYNRFAVNTAVDGTAPFPTAHGSGR